MDLVQESIRIDLASFREKLLHGVSCIRVAETATLFPASAHTPFHSHPELFLQLGGATRFTMPDGCLTLETGELCVMPAGVPHGEEALDGETSFRTLVLMFIRDQFGCIYGRAGGKALPVIDEIRSYEAVDPAQVDKLLQACRHFALRPGRNSWAQQIMGALMGIAIEATQHPQDPASREQWSPLVARCVNLLQQRFSSPSCNVAGLAVELGCTPNYLSSKFRRETGASLSSRLKDCRLEAARERLEHAAFSVQAIASACGFEHTSYFIACFKQRYGMTPKAWRERGVKKEASL